MRKLPASRIVDDEPISPSPLLREVAVLPGLGERISVRAAKAHLSALLNLVESGYEITITSSGKPNARLSGIEKCRTRVPFTGTRSYLASMAKWDGGPTADEIIRADRDGRGW